MVQLGELTLALILSSLIGLERCYLEKADARRVLMPRNPQAADGVAMLTRAICTVDFVGADIAKVMRPVIVTLHSHFGLQQAGFREGEYCVADNHVVEGHDVDECGWTDQQNALFQCTLGRR